MGVPRYLPYEQGPHRHRVGTRTLDPLTWIEFGPDADGQLAAKRDLLATRHADVVRVQAGPDVDAASRELLEALTAHLAATFPNRDVPDRDVPDRDVPGRDVPGRDVPGHGGLHPLDAAARLVPEDLCLHLPGADGRLRLVAGSVAFPSGWRLADKLGQPVGDVHAPVPGYAAAIGTPVDRLLAALKPGRGLWRLNGSIHPDATLFRPEPPRRSAPPRVPEDIVLRVERQTLRRLPRTGAVVFTIRTYVDPLTSIAGDPSALATVAGWLRGLPAEQRDYKELTAIARPVLAWLDGPRS